MKRINIMVSDKAKEIIQIYQRENNLTTLDEEIDKFILEYNPF